MKKLLIIMFALLVGTTALDAQSIAYVKQKNGYYQLYNDNGRVVANISTDNKTTLVGYSERLVVLKKDGYYIIYKCTGVKVGTVDADLVGPIKRVLKDGFISERKGYLYKWNEEGSKYTIIGSK